MGRNRGGLVVYVEAQLERDISLERLPPSAFSAPLGLMRGDSYTAKGTYRASLTVTDWKGVQNTDTRVITVK
ncbi:hypothetical protein D7V80_12540 [Corallococcus sp. CA054B]|uniref:hypothetical protein n=1 Tax=Corallococcus sp. CA054B TaxID=2316734 RepID=UPI000EA02E96|nr:hypothetical protein [Corallococcus sp. CA054B]RKG68449.1 hypothetical protein D7V80_12540 [Corallococcus sp. CA054B]